MEVGKYTFEVSNRDKVFFPGKKYTKEDLMDYYDKIFETMFPYLQDRPITMIRFPDGIHGKQFYQKDAPDYFPDWIELKEIEKKEAGTTNYVICNDKATLIYLASQACITPHIWLSRKDKLEYPDSMIFDLDPSDNDFSKVKSVAKKIKDLLADKLGLPVFLMTTGSKGLHVITPLQRNAKFDEIRSFTQSVAEYLEQNDNDEEITTAIRKNKRGNKVFIDTARNSFGQTAVAPYSVRPLKGAPVATPISWDELSSLNSSQHYHIKNIFKRLAQKDDPWKNMDQHAATINAAKKKLAEMMVPQKK
jgi:bifunctional non-homologous end joining protein LigD